MPERRQRKGLAGANKPPQRDAEQRRRRGGHQAKASLAARRQAAKRSHTGTVLNPFEDELAVVSEMGPPSLRPHF